MDLQMSLGMTFLIVTHDQEEAMTVADRIAVMNHGVLVQVAPPAEIYEQPATRYIADFIGEVNLIESTVTACEGETHAPHLRGGRTSPLTVAHPCEAGLPAARPASPSGRRSCAFRSIRRLRGRENVFAGEIWDIGYLGDLSIYHVELACGQRLKVSQPNLSRRVSAAHFLGGQGVGHV